MISDPGPTETPMDSRSHPSQSESDSRTTARIMALPGTSTIAPSCKTGQAPERLGKRGSDVDPSDAIPSSPRGTISWLHDRKSVHSVWVLAAAIVAAGQAPFETSDPTPVPAENAKEPESAPSAVVQVPLMARSPKRGPTIPAMVIPRSE